MNETPVNPPSNVLLLTEFPRAAKEAMDLFSFQWRGQLSKAPKGDGQPVLTIPGFGGADGCMSMLRQFLNRLGYKAYPWKLGRNLPDGRVTQMDEILAYCKMREEQLVKRIIEIKEETGQKVSLIGWSMGGVFANTLAQTHPDLVAQVITLGAPVGNPKLTSTWNLLKYLNMSTVDDDLQNVEAWEFRKNQLGERTVRSSVIYSEMDGAVSKHAAMIEDDDFVENIHVRSSHVGFSHNPLVYWVVAERLAQDKENWEAFDISMQPPKIQRCFNH
ncbi:MAG: alpha/beta fold hydrolase [Cellvibrionales bacterium]|nr:alpha/beta fold hydrolase [Cellvibrionales bacterium]